MTKNQSIGYYDVIPILEVILMRIFVYRLVLPLLIGCVTCVGAQAASQLVKSEAEYKRAVKTLQPGDSIVLANGEWKDFEISFVGMGTKDKPITLTAQEKGKVIVSGRSNLRLGGEYLVVSGLVFKNGHTPTREVIAFRNSKQLLANHSRVTEVVIDGFNNPERTETDYWVTMYGKNNRFDHNYLAGKSNNGVTMAVRLDSESSIKNNHRIDHNYFGHRPILGSNGGETMRIGTSHYSMSDSLTLVENNYFDRCDGEVEIISSKSGGNIFRGNLFYESRGTLTLRHGNGNLVENNVFLGNGVDHTGGIRVINKRQTVRNNYLQGLTGTRFGSALVIMNGVPDSPINRYHQVEDSVIENNTIIGSSHIELAGGSDEERSAVPTSTKFVNNLIYNEDSRNIITAHDDVSGITFKGNVLNEDTESIVNSGFEALDIKLERLPNGLQHAGANVPLSAGASRDLKVLDRDDTGPDWYPKPDGNNGFGSGKTYHVKAEGDKLIEALESAQPGDVLELKPGNYLVEKLLVIDKPLTIKVMEGATVTVEFERNTLFEIQDGGALQLQGFTISGKSAPDVAGNSVIRTSRYSMLNSYQLLVDGMTIEHMNVNHTFDFLRVAKGTFAERIEITNSNFSDVTGNILGLEKETDDLGLYNAEYVIIRNSKFNNVGQSLLNIYRGGTDESTFGPHVDIRDSYFDAVGNSKRNKPGASVFMLGVQVATISNNEFTNSRAIKVVQTVGEPVTSITDNQFIDTASPEITNGGARLSGNTVSGAVQP